MSDANEMSRVESKRRHQQVKDRIRSYAESTRRPNDLIQYQLVFECFLKRLFRGNDGTWAIKGGAALLLRGSGSRTTTDIDLVAEANLSVGQIEDELRAAAERDADDVFNFEILKLEEKRKPDASGYRGATYKALVIARIGQREFKTFSIDITEHRHTQDPFEEVEVHPLLGQLLPHGAGKFRILATSMEGQIADKICAMRETHATGLSTRYHDLADLAGIIETQKFSARGVRKRVDDEARRRKIQPPTDITAPAGWKQPYEKNAPNFNIATKFHNFESTLNYVADCFNPVLMNEIQHASWDPVKQAWI